jgi:hypothetical protein
MGEDKRQQSKWPSEKNARLKAAKTLLNSGRGNMLMVLALKVGIEGVSKLKADTETRRRKRRHAIIARLFFGRIRKDSPPICRQVRE